MANEKISPAKAASLKAYAEKEANPKVKPLKATDREKRRSDSDRVCEKVEALIAEIHKSGKAYCMFDMAKFIASCELSKMYKKRAIEEFGDALTGSTFIDTYGEWALYQYEGFNSYALIRLSLPGQPILMYRDTEIFYIEEKHRQMAQAEFAEHEETEANWNNPNWVDPNETTFDADGKIVYNDEAGKKASKKAAN